MHKTILRDEWSRGRDATKACAFCERAFVKDKRNTWAYWESAKYCCQACAGKARTADAEANRAPMADKFWSWVEKTDGCWLWRGACNNQRGGYGAFSYGGQTIAAHVTALKLVGREPSKGQYVCHTCDNPPCVNPDHLYIGSAADNVRDMLARARHQHGGGHYASKLTDADVLAIRASTERCGVLARQYGVSYSNVSMIRARKTWKHLP